MQWYRPTCMQRRSKVVQEEKNCEAIQEWLESESNGRGVCRNAVHAQIKRRCVPDATEPPPLVFDHEYLRSNSEHPRSAFHSTSLVKFYVALQGSFNPLFRQSLKI